MNGRSGHGLFMLNTPCFSWHRITLISCNHLRQEQAHKLGPAGSLLLEDYPRSKVFPDCSCPNRDEAIPWHRLFFNMIIRADFARWLMTDSKDIWAGLNFCGKPFLNFTPRIPQLGIQANFGKCSWDWHGHRTFVLLV